MTQKEITINGKTYPIVFNLKTMVGYEDIIGRSFFGEKFEKLHERIALVIAAIYAADEDAGITSDDILKNDSWESAKQVIEAFTAVILLSKEFFKIPEVEQKGSEEAKEKEQDAKN